MFFIVYVYILYIKMYSRTIWSIFTACIHIIQAITVTVLIFTHEALKSNHGSFKLYTFIPKYNSTDIVHKQVVDFYVPFWIVVFFALSAFFQFSSAYLFNTEKTLLQNIRLRYIEYCFSASIMILCIAVEVGIFDLSLLMCMALLIFITNVFGYIADICVTVIPELHMHWHLHYMGWITCISPYAVIIYHYYLSITENQSPPWFVHMIVFGMFSLFSCFGAVQNYDFRYRNLPLQQSREDMLEAKRIHTFHFVRGTNKTYNVATTISPLNRHLAHVVVIYDTLSLTAKSMLCWLILTPLLNKVF
jgi:hypothetical protein